MLKLTGIVFIVSTVVWATYMWSEQPCYEYILNEETGQHVWIECNI